MSENYQQSETVINDKSHGSAFTYLRCGMW